MDGMNDYLQTPDGARVRLAATWLEALQRGPLADLRSTQPTRGERSVGEIPARA